jgi:vacuolar-type H+-ATPase subunit H
MSFEAIKQVTDTEQTLRERKVEAQAEAKRITAEAERAGRELLEQAKTSAEAQAKKLLAEAEARADGSNRKVLADNAAACEALKQGARTRLDRAADLIVGWVVKS